MLKRLYKTSPLVRKRVHAAKDVAIYRLVSAVLAIAPRYPLERLFDVSDRIASAAYGRFHKTRRHALQHLEMVLGDRVGPAEREEIAKESLRNFARSFCEIAKIDEIRPRLDEYLHLTGWEKVTPILDQGGIVCSAHIGNWELAGAYMAHEKGLPVTAVARRLDEPRLNKMLVDIRSRNGVETIMRDSPSASRQLLGALRKHGFLVMLIDQDTLVPSITVPFLGRPARTPVAPAALAVRRNLPIVVTYSVRRPNGGLDLILQGPLYADKNLDRDSSILELTTRTNELIGDAILQHPTQWPWWHRRWRRAPQPHLDPDAPKD